MDLFTCACQNCQRQTGSVCRRSQRKLEKKQVTVFVWIILLSAFIGSVNSNQQACPSGDGTCERDRFGFEAISQLHENIDDDRNGNLDREESDEFIRDELKYEDGFDRQVTFHGSDDLISITDLWKLWSSSSVYNWTVDDVVDWLIQDVELPQYEENFRVNAVDGHILPRLAASSQYMTSILGIKNGVHKQKVSVRATDLVLFGPPKRHNYIKDLALVCSLVVALGGCWLAYVQHRYSQEHIRKVMRELEALQRAEDNLHGLQTKLEEAEKVQQNVEQEKQHLEEKLKDEIDTAKAEAERLRTTREATEEEISRLKLAEDELVQVRMALHEAERQIEERHNAPLAELQQWLQLTHELEKTHYDAKREAAEKQLLIAKEMCDKIRRKRGAFLGSLRIAHTTSIDDTDHSIMKARSALEDTKLLLQERSQRWKQIEKVCGFGIQQNPGLKILETTLRGGTMSRSASSSTFAGYGLAPMSMDEADNEDMNPGQLAAAAVPTMIPPEMHRRSMTTLASAFGGSSSSISTHQGTPPRHLNGPVSRTKPTMAPPTSGVVDDSDTVSTTESTDSVKFNLGDCSPSVEDEDIRGRTSSFGRMSGVASHVSSVGHSVSVGAAVTQHSVTRPKVLKTSHSESAISSMPSQTQNGKTHKRTSADPKLSDVSPTLPEEDSSQDSNDNSSLGSVTELKASKNKKKGLKNLFKPGSMKGKKEKSL